MTIYTHTKFGPDDGQTIPDRWMPWLNVTDRNEAVSMAAHKFCRESGRLPPGSSPLVLTVYHTETDPETRPMIVDFSTVKLSRE